MASSRVRLNTAATEVQRTETSADLDEPVVKEEILPVIDFGLLTEGTPDQRSKAVRELNRACQDWGFFLLVNHGVPEKMREEMMDKFKGFFDLTPGEKGEYANTDVMNPIRHGTGFNTAVDDVRYWRSYLKTCVHPEFHSPTKPPGFRELLREYSTRIRDLGMKLLGGIWESLGLEESYMKEALELDSCYQVVVGNFYPPCPQPELATGLGPHSDHGLLTFLYQNGVDGLEVKHEGRWVRVKPSPNSYIVNIGDHMEIVSNGRYQSVLHRAYLNDRSTRLSIVSVVGASLETVVIPAPPLVSSDRPPAFRGMKYGEFVEYQQSHTLKEKSVLELLRV
ncbi:protein DMR6-LIKE OXYGENASE 1-like [Iris pallida]|uniref:Protein DMR6-LIKE OXYGENASE 1-like n=1 Tax=Iris pallida TaxID=29817 RepID=A0AAX6IBS2_IRIPA|nr:protein DMR6-LIKE OXYGENASE 1-like [Iris pallida]